MFSKIVFNIDGSEIELHLHEVVKLAIDIVSKEPGIKPDRVSDPSIANQIIDIVLQPSTIYSKFLIELYEEKNDHTLFIPACFIGMNSLKHWLYVAKYCATKPQIDNISAWWLFVSSRLLHIDISDRFLYVSDHGALRDIVHDVKDLAIDFPWITKPELTCEVIKLQQSFEGYRIFLLHPEGEVMEGVIYIYLGNQGKSDEILQYQVISLENGLVTGRLSRERLGDKYYNSIKKKTQGPEFRKKLTIEEKNAVIGITHSHGHTKSLDELRQELEKIKSDYVKAVINDQYEQIKFLDSTKTKAKFLEIQRKYQTDPDYVNLELARNIELTSYLINTLVNKFMRLTFTAEANPLLREIYKKCIVETQNEDKPGEVPLWTLLDSYIKRFVLGELAKEINLGRHESLYRPVFSYGRKEVGDAYHEFAATIRSYFSLPNALSAKKLAAVMRSIIEGKSINDDSLAFLPNLTVAWFIAEGARNNTVVLTSMMLIDLIENGVQLINNGLDLYEWQYTLIHPYNDDSTKVVYDLYGVEVKKIKDATGPQRIGGSHPMTHHGSATQGKLLQENTNLNISRQKEGSLILHWLYEHIRRLDPDLIKGLVCAEKERPIKKPSYKEVEYTDQELDGKIKDKESDIRRKQKGNPDADVKKEKEDISYYVKQKKKQKLIEDWVKPLLKLRLSSTKNFIFNLEKIACILKKAGACLNAEKIDAQISKRFRITDNPAQIAQRKKEAVRHNWKSCSQLINDYRIIIKDHGANGDCLFRAVAAQLGASLKMGTIGNIERDAGILRAITVVALRSQVEIFRHLLTDEELMTTNRVIKTQDFDHYLHFMALPGTWGGQIELFVLASLLERPIILLSENIRPQFFEEASIGVPMFLYYTGDHYQAVIPRRETARNTYTQILHELDPNILQQRDMYHFITVQKLENRLWRRYQKIEDIRRNERLRESDPYHLAVVPYTGQVYKR